MTPTLKAAEVAAAETGADGHSAAWLVHQHGWRWDTDGHWARRPDATPDPAARLRPGDLLLVDEAGMLDQDTARALLTIADEAGARVALVGDRHQLPAVGRGGVLDHAIAWAHPTAVVTLEKVHRFTDPDYAALSLRMRTGEDPAAVFDALHRRGQVVIHPSEIERTAALAEAGATGDLVVADTREQVASLNAAIRDQRRADTGDGRPGGIVGDRSGRTDRARGPGRHPPQRPRPRGREPADLDRHRHRRGRQPHPPRRRGRDRVLPAEYATRFVELAYATTVHGAQGETVDRAHVAIGDTTGAAAAYVAMTRGRNGNTAHLVAETVEEARKQWVEVFGRDRADLGPAHAKRQAIEAIDRYGTQKRRRPWPTRAAPTAPGVRRRDRHLRSVTPLAPADRPPLDADLAGEPGAEAGRVTRRHVLGGGGRVDDRLPGFADHVGEVQPLPDLHQQDAVDGVEHEIDAPSPMTHS